MMWCLLNWLMCDWGGNECRDHTLLSWVAEETKWLPQLTRLVQSPSTHVWIFSVQSDFRQPPGYAIFPKLKVTGKLRPSFLKVKSSLYCSKDTFCYNLTCGNPLPIVSFFYLVFISCLYVTHIISNVISLASFSLQALEIFVAHFPTMWWLF